MNTNIDDLSPDTLVTAAHDSAAPQGRTARRWKVDPRVDRFSGLYLSIILIVVFSVWLPETFGTLINARVILAGAAITGIVTLAAMLGLISGAFDVSVGANMSFAISLVGYLQAERHVNALLAVIITVAAGAVVGSLNAFIIAKLHVDPVIATLGMSSLLVAGAYWVANGETYSTGLSERFVSLGQNQWLSVPLPVFYLAAISLVLWYVLEHTPLGRYLYASGSNPTASRLAGLPVARLQWMTLMVRGMLSAFAGVVLTMQLGAASFGSGQSYLLPAFAAAFLGATQIRPGRFNVGGTLVALYLLAIGIKGLQLRYPGLPWIADLFQGLALIVAVTLGVTAARRRAARG